MSKTTILYTVLFGLLCSVGAWYFGWIMMPIAIVGGLSVGMWRGSVDPL